MDVALFMGLYPYTDNEDTCVTPNSTCQLRRYMDLGILEGLRMPSNKWRVDHGGTRVGVSDIQLYTLTFVRGNCYLPLSTTACRTCSSSYPAR